MITIEQLEAAEQALQQQKLDATRTLYKAEGALEVVRGQLLILRKAQALTAPHISNS